MRSYTSFSTEPFEIKLNKEIDVNSDIMLCAIMTLCYNSKQWAGKIIEQNDENEDYSINFMHPDLMNLTNLYWPKSKDKCWILDKNILTEIENPIPESSFARKSKLPNIIKSFVVNMFSNY